MKDAMEFEMLLDDVLREVANPEPEEGLIQRLALRMEMAAASRIYESAQTGLFEGGPKQEGLFRSIWSGLQELMSPKELAPLALESRPVAVVDPYGSATKLSCDRMGGGCACFRDSDDWLCGYDHVFILQHRLICERLRWQIRRRAYRRLGR